MEQVRQRTERLDQLVHCAAATIPGRLTEVAADDLSRSVAVNGLALIGLVGSAADLLTAGSSVVYISSQGAREVISGYGALGIAKALGEHAVRYLAVELAPRGGNAGHQGGQGNVPRPIREGRRSRRPQ